MSPDLEALLLALLLCGCATGTPGGIDASGSGGVDASDRVDGGVVADARVIDAAAPADAPGTDPACAIAIAQLAYDWESGDQGWVHDVMPAVDPPPVSWTFDHWERGTPTHGPPCNGGTACWATNLDNNYIQCQRAYLRSPSMNLSACADTDVSLVFNHAFDFWTGTWDSQTWYDGGMVELSGDGTTWQAASISYPGTILINPDQGSSYTCVEGSSFYVHNTPGFVSANGGWQQVAIPIPPALRTASFQVRFLYASGVSWQTTDEITSMDHTRAGWYIDDVSVQ